jgi:hypothetical protein
MTTLVFSKEGIGFQPIETEDDTLARYLAEALVDKGFTVESHTEASTQ